MEGISIRPCSSESSFFGVALKRESLGSKKLIPSPNYKSLAVRNSIYFPHENVIQPRAAKSKPPVIMPAVFGHGGPMDIASAFYKNRTIFVGSNINSQVTQKVITQLLALEAIDENAEIKVYINSPGGSPYNIFAIYDCIAWIKPDVSTIGMGMVASQATLLLASGTKGKRFAMPNTRVMMHQPQSGSGGNVQDVMKQAEEALVTKDKVEKMYSEFCGRTLPEIQAQTERDSFFSAAAAMEFGIVDALIETAY